MGLIPHNLPAPTPHYQSSEGAETGLMGLKQKYLIHTSYISAEPRNGAQYQQDPEISISIAISSNDMYY